MKWEMPRAQLIAGVLLLLLFSGCTSEEPKVGYGFTIKGHQENQYFVIVTTSFLGSSNSSLVEYYQIPSGSYAGRWTKVRTVLPSSLTRERKPAPTKEKAVKPRNQGKENDNGWTTLE